MQQGHPSDPSAREPSAPGREGALHPEGGTAGKHGGSREGDEFSVVLASANLLFAQALSSFVTSAGMRVLGVTATMNEAYELVERREPNLLLIGLSSGDRTPLPLLQKLRERWPGMAVLAIMEHGDEVPDDATASLVTGVVAMEMSSSSLLDAIERAGRGQSVEPLQKRPSRRSHEEFLLDQLTPRELDVLALLAEGSNSQAIAERLDITTNTVRTHVQNILSKLNVSSRLGAASLAIRRGGVRDLRPDRD